MLSGLDSAWLEKILGEFCGRIWRFNFGQLDVSSGWKKFGSVLRLDSDVVDLGLGAPLVLMGRSPRGDHQC